MIQEKDKTIEELCSKYVQEVSDRYYAETGKSIRSASAVDKFNAALDCMTYVVRDLHQMPFELQNINFTKKEDWERYKDILNAMYRAALYEDESSKEKLSWVPNQVIYFEHPYIKGKYVPNPKHTLLMKEYDWRYRKRVHKFFLTNNLYQSEKNLIDYIKETEWFKENPELNINECVADIEKNFSNSYSDEYIKNAEGITFDESSKVTISNMIPADNTPVLHSLCKNDDKLSQVMNPLIDDINALDRLLQKVNREKGLTRIYGINKIQEHLGEYNRHLEDVRNEIQKDPDKYRKDVLDYIFDYLKSVDSRYTGKYSKYENGIAYHKLGGEIKNKDYLRQIYCNIPLDCIKIKIGLMQIDVQSLNRAVCVLGITTDKEILISSKSIGEYNLRHSFAENGLTNDKGGADVKKVRQYIKDYLTECGNAAHLTQEDIEKCQRNVLPLMTLQVLNDSKVLSVNHKDEIQK